MIYRIAANLVLLAHLAFVVFVVLGGWVVLRRPGLALVHVPAAAWGAWIELAGDVCPLTPLENRLRAVSGAAGYSEGFIEHYIVALVYPAGLTRPVQLALGVGVVLVNLFFYGLLLRRWGRNEKDAEQ